MDYFFNILQGVVKSAIVSDNAVGIVVEGRIDDHQQFVDAISTVLDDVYLAIDGCPATDLTLPANVHYSSKVTDVVKWRNQDICHGKTIFQCSRLQNTKRSHSLRDFRIIDSRDIIVAIANEQSASASNVPTKTFWNALRDEERETGCFPLNCVLRFVDALKRGEQLEQALWYLNLVPDDMILTPKCDVRHRFHDNRTTIEQINSMDDRIRNTLAESLAHLNTREKSVYRIIMDYFRKNEFDLLKSVYLDEVSSLISKIKKPNPGPPPPPGGDGPKKKKGPKDILVDDFDAALSGDQDAKRRMDDFGKSLIDWTDNTEDPYSDETDSPSITDDDTGETLAFPPDEVSQELYKIIRHCAQPEGAWGGIVFSKNLSLRETIKAANEICTSEDQFQPFLPISDKIENPFFEQCTGLRTILSRFDDALTARGVNSSLASQFDELADRRKRAFPAINALTLFGHLGVLGGRKEALAAVRGYVKAWQNFLTSFQNVEEVMHEISDRLYQGAARCILSLDVLYFLVGKEWKAILLPPNPLYLWAYCELYGQIADETQDFSADEIRIPLVKAVVKLPNLINFILVPREVVALSGVNPAEDRILPCSGAQGSLPSFENKTNRYLGNDGIECISDTMTRYLAFAPYAANDLKICVVDSPDVLPCLHQIVDCMDKQPKSRFSKKVEVVFYLTESHSTGVVPSAGDFARQDENIAEMIRTNRLLVRIVSCKGAGQVADTLTDNPVHLAFFFDQSTYQVSYGMNARELFISPLVVSYDFKYYEIENTGEIFPNTSTGDGFLGSYYAVLEKTGTMCSRSRVPRTSYLANAEQKKILSLLPEGKTQWLILADRVVFNCVPDTGLPIGVKNFGRRNVAIWANQDSRVIQQYEELLQQYNLHPQKDALIKAFSRFGHISGEGLVGIPARQLGFSQAAESRRKGLLGTVLAALWYSRNYPDSLIASLDSDEGRTWLGRTIFDGEEDNNDRADLVGFRRDPETGAVVIDVLEVKARSTVGSHAAEQTIAVMKRLAEIFQPVGENERNMFTAARKETLKYQIVSECFRCRYLSREQVKEWDESLRKVFSEGDVKIEGAVVHVDLENNSESVPEEKRTTNDGLFSYRLVTLTARQIQREFFPPPTTGKRIAVHSASDTTTNESPAVHEPDFQPPPDNEEPFSDNKSTGGTIKQDEKERSKPPETQTASDNAVNVSVASANAPYSEETLSGLIHSFWNACRSFGIAISSCNVEDVKIGPSVIRLYLTLEHGQRIEPLRRSLSDIGRQIAHTELLITQIPDSNKIALDIVRKDRQFPAFEEQVPNLTPSAAIEQMPILVGQTPDGENIVQRLDEMPHLLVGGTTGGGKTIFLSTLLLSLLTTHPSKDDLRLLILSSKTEDFLAFMDIPHLLGQGLVADALEAVKIIQTEIFEETRKRQQLFMSARVSKISDYNTKQRQSGGKQLPPLVVLIDEFADLTDNLHDKNSRESFFRVLRQIAQTGRSRGIHLVLCTQRPSAKILDTTIKSQLPVRVALKVASAFDAKIILDVSDSGAERLQGKGDLILRDSESFLHRAQGYNLDLTTLYDLVMKIVNPQ